MDAPWFKPITIQSRAQIMRKLAKMRDSGAALPRENKPVLNFALFKYPRYGTKVYLNEKYVTFYSLTDMRKFFQVERSTLYRWDKLGIIPPAVFQRLNKYQKPQRFWIRAQIRVMNTVINDLRRQGIYKLTKENTRFHVQMVRDGNEYVLRQKEQYADTTGLRKSMGKRGVSWVKD